MDELEQQLAVFTAARAASPSGGRVVWCQWCACFEDDPRCTCPAEPKPCPGIEIEPGRYSGCTAAQTGAKDCPACGPRLTCANCDETVLEVESGEREPDLLQRTRST